MPEPVKLPLEQKFLLYIKAELISRTDNHFLFKIQLPRAIVSGLQNLTGWKFIRDSDFTEPIDIVRELKERRYVPDRWPTRDDRQKEVENPALMLAFWEQQSDKAIEIFDVLTRHGVAIDVALPVVEPYLIEDYMVRGAIWNLDKTPRAIENPQFYPLSRELADLVEKMAIELKKAEVKNG
jgi:hypothetical protein